MSSNFWECGDSPAPLPKTHCPLLFQGGLLETLGRIHPLAVGNSGASRVGSMQSRGASCVSKCSMSGEYCSGHPQDTHALLGSLGPQVKRDVV